MNFNFLNKFLTSIFTIIIISGLSVTVFAESSYVGVGEGISRDGKSQVPNHYSEYSKSESRVATFDVGAAVDPLEGCSCVVFRFDDLQDGWLEEVQVYMMQDFIDRNEPLSVGPIFGIFGGGSPTIVETKAVDGYNSGLFEFFNHGWFHNNFTLEPLSNQTAHLELGQARATDVFGINSTVFIPPFNAFNANTLTALSNTGFKIISSEPALELDQGDIFTADGSVPHTVDSLGLYHLPSPVKFVEYSPNATRIPPSQIFDDIDFEIANRGYAIVTLHQQEFANKVNGSEVDSINMTLYDDLTEVLDYVIDTKKYPIRTFEQVVAFNGTVSINDVTQIEGNSGITNFNFTITRSNNSGNMSVEYDTSDGTATLANSDYSSTSGTVNFTDGGDLTEQVTVQVNGDNTEESDETFNVDLSNCIGCTITDSQGEGTITNDDANISIDNVTQVEGNSGTSNFVFTVTRTNNTAAMSVDYQTADNTATQPSDYIAKSGTLNFTKNGSFTDTIEVSVKGDVIDEANEIFFINLSNCVGCIITVPQATGTIKSECETLPVSEIWIISTSCILENNFTSPDNIIVQNGAVLTIPSSVTLSVPSGNNITIASGGGVLIESGGSLTITS